MRRLVLWCAFGIAVVPAVAARGIDLVVNSTLDQIDADVTDGICQTAAGTCTLRAAVMTANRATGAVRVDIFVPPGTFEITRPPIGTNGDDGGDLDLTAPLSGNPLIVLQGAGVGATVIDALDADRVVRVHAGRRAVIQDLTLRQGFAAQTTDGGGCVRNAGDLWMERVSLENCVAADGAAVFSSGTGAVLVLGTSTLLSNTASGDGGAVWSDGDTTIFGSQFFFNLASRAGGVHIAPGGDVAITGSTFLFNFVGGEGGALLVEGVAQLHASILDANSGETGGGASVRAGGALLVEDSTIVDNEASFGGGLNVGGLLVSSRSAIVSNSALFGGGLHVETTGEVVVSNATVSANAALESGGGLYLEGSPELNIFSSTIAFNQADSDQNDTGDGGGVFNEDAVFNIRHCLVAGNYVFDPQSNPDDCVGTVHSFGRNLFGDVAGCAVVTGSGSWGLLNGLELLGPLAWNGGPTPTHALLLGSNAVDGGDPVHGCITANGVPLTVDQRGEPRTIGTLCDIGAYERGPLVFSDGFETNGTTRWSGSSGL